MKAILVTGSNGLIGSEMVTHFHGLGWSVHGVDNNMRANFFGPEGDTRWNQQRLLVNVPDSLTMNMTCATAQAFSTS